VAEIGNVYQGDSGQIVTLEVTSARWRQPHSSWTAIGFDRRDGMSTALAALRRALLLGSALGAVLCFAVDVRAQCVCDGGDGRFTTHTGIAVDGAFGDWNSPLADPDNSVCDGPTGGLVDRDAPVQSTGRDIDHFAFTWDDTQVYLYTHRVGSTNNVQRFVYYADTDNDGLLETGERVIGVNWNGNTRLLEVYLFEYAALAPGGDPMTDGGGYGDGYTMPGGFQNVPAQNSPTRSGTWGSANGLSMEFPIAWAELGIAAGSPFRFHVSSANAYFNAASFTAQIDDNLSGCGGGVGSTQFAALEFTPDRALSGKQGELVFAAHTLTNQGNAADSFDLAWTIAGDHTPAVTWYLDADASGTYTAGDVALGDSDGDLAPDTGSLAVSVSIALLAGYTIADNGLLDPSGVASVATLATSSFDTDVDAAVTDTVTVVLTAEPHVTKSLVTISGPVNGVVNPRAIPGAIIEYTVLVGNGGAGPVDDGALLVRDAIPVRGALYVGDISGVGSGPVAFSEGAIATGLTYGFTSLASLADDVDFSNDGGSTWSYVPVPDGAGFDDAVTHLQVRPAGSFNAATLAGNPSFQLRFRMRID
jgi:hypothetical protein